MAGRRALSPARLLRLALPLAVVLLVAAPILRFWVAPALAQAPADPAPVDFVESGTVTSLFDVETGTLDEPLVVTRTTHTEADPTATAEADAAGQNVTVTTTRQTLVTADGRALSELDFRLAADRRSQALIDCCAVAVGGVPVPMAGAGSPLRLPWLTPRSAYPYFDPTLLRAVEMSYLGGEEVNGTDAAKFQQATPATALGTVTAPGTVVGSEQPTVTLTRVHSVNRTLWVDPTTGIILRSAERVRETLRDADGKDVVVLLAMSLASTEQTEAAQRTLAAEQGRPVLWASAYGPLILGALGLLLLMAGVAGEVRRVRQERVTEDFPDEPATFDDLRGLPDEPPDEA